MNQSNMKQLVLELRLAVLVPTDIVYKKLNAINPPNSEYSCQLAVLSVKVAYHPVQK